MFSNVPVGFWSNLVNCFLYRIHKHFSKYFDQFIITTLCPLSYFIMKMALFIDNCFIISWYLFGVFVVQYFSNVDRNFVFILFSWCCGIFEISFMFSWKYSNSVLTIFLLMSGGTCWSNLNDHTLISFSNKL